MEQKIPKQMKKRSKDTIHDSVVTPLCSKNYGHLLMTVNILYDVASYWRPQKVEEERGRVVDVEAIVETPHI